MCEQCKQIYFYCRLVNIDGVCEVMADVTIVSDAEAIAQVLRFLLPDDQECIDIDYETIIEADRQTGWDDPAVAGGFRQYSYQACTQVFYLVTV